MIQGPSHASQSLHRYNTDTTEPLITHDIDQDVAPERDTEVNIASLLTEPNAAVIVSRVCTTGKRTSAP